MRLSHIGPGGSVAMVDISAKNPTARFARAEAYVSMNEQARAALREVTLSKGDAFVTAQLAGIMAAKQTATLIPLTHPLPLTGIDVSLEWCDDGRLRVEAQARTTAPTGVEMEAMVAAS